MADAGLEGRHVGHMLPLAVSALGRTPPLPTCPWPSPSSTALRRTLLLRGGKSQVLARGQQLHQGCSANSCCCIRAERKVQICKDACVFWEQKKIRKTPKKLEANNYELRNRYTTNRWTMKLVKKEVGPKHYLIAWLKFNVPIKDPWDRGLCEKFGILLRSNKTQEIMYVCVHVHTYRKDRNLTFCWVS